MTKKEIEELWEKFGDIPIDEKECIDVDFHIWKKGTNRYDIWHWFDEEFSEGIGVLMYRE